VLLPMAQSSHGKLKKNGQLVQKLTETETQETDNVCLMRLLIAIK